MRLLEKLLTVGIQDDDPPARRELVRTQNIMMVGGLGLAAVEAVGLWMAVEHPVVPYCLAIWGLAFLSCVCGLVLHQRGQMLGYLAFSASSWVVSFALTAVAGVHSLALVFVMAGPGTGSITVGSRHFNTATGVFVGLLLLLFAFVAGAPLHPLAGSPFSEAELRAFAALHLGGSFGFLLVANRLVANRLRDGRRALRREQARSDRLLHNVLPAPIVVRMKAGETPIVDRHPEASVLFADIVGFTGFAENQPPVEVVDLLDELFRRYDAIADARGIQKIKTLGDGYMAAAMGGPDHAAQAARMALEMREATRAVALARGLNLSIRIGIHTGALIAGVIGTKRFAYDIWGDTVNVASRMESHGEPDRIQISDACREALEEGFSTAPRGEIEVKGKGRMTVWFLEEMPERMFVDREP